MFYRHVMGVYRLMESWNVGCFKIMPECQETLRTGVATGCPLVATGQDASTEAADTLAEPDGGTGKASGGLDGTKACGESKTHIL